VSVDVETVVEMATLARLAVPEDRLGLVAEEMSAILDFMGAITQWEGGVPSVGPPTTRRDDTPISPDVTIMKSATTAQTGAVTVPPIKDAS